jgi:polar amino acid transport system permease protein
MEPGTFLYEVWIARWSLLSGLGITLSASALALALGTAVGLLGGVLLTYGVLPLRWAMRLYVDVIRGIPVLVLILITYYIPAVFKLNLPAFWAGVLALAAFCTAHVAETVRGAIQSLPVGQTEAGKAIGLTFLQRLRYIVVPLAARRALPPWVNTGLEIVKGTTLLSVIGVVEFLLTNQQAVARNYMTLQFYGAATAVYFAFCFPVGRLASRLERRFAHFRY